MSNNSHKLNFPMINIPLAFTNSFTKMSANLAPKTQKPKPLAANLAPKTRKPKPNDKIKLIPHYRLETPHPKSATFQDIPPEILQIILFYTCLYHDFSLVWGVLSMVCKSFQNHLPWVVLKKIIEDDNIELLNQWHQRYLDCISVMQLTGTDAIRFPYISLALQADASSSKKILATGWIWEYFIRKAHRVESTNLDHPEEPFRRHLNDKGTDELSLYILKVNPEFYLKFDNLKMALKFYHAKTTFGSGARHYVMRFIGDAYYLGTYSLIDYVEENAVEIFGSSLDRYANLSTAIAREISRCINGSANTFPDEDTSSRKRLRVPISDEIKGKWYKELLRMQPHGHVH